VSPRYLSLLFRFFFHGPRNGEFPNAAKFDANVLWTGRRVSQVTDAPIAYGQERTPLSSSACALTIVKVAWVLEPGSRTVVPALAKLLGWADKTNHATTVGINSASS